MISDADISPPTPLIVIRDESNSMCGDLLDRSCEILTRVFAHAAATGRDLHVIHFSDARSRRTDSFPGGAPTPGATRDCISHFFGGGGDYNGAIEEALGLCSRHPVDGADVLIIGDGPLYVSERLRESWAGTRSAKSLRVTGLTLRPAEPSVRRTVRRVADMVRFAPDLRTLRRALSEFLSAGKDPGVAKA